MRNLLKNLLYALAIALLIFSVNSFKSMRRFRFVNNCDKTIWIGSFGVPLPAVTGWEMPSHS